MTILLIEPHHRSAREALAERDLTNLLRAREIIARWVEHYNTERLHAGLGYLPPTENYRGQPERRPSEQRAKLAQARAHRRAINQQRLTKAA
ncbi:MAG TPA: integrase core domain-containing protein [Gemmatimonadales bacterium]|nr:integrase core domain-containing protein [Gemmatimonadales bacterium]